MKEKKRKGIGCATILVLLPIPGMIIYGLVTDNFDLAHGFVYGCIVSLVFLIFNIISAIKNRASDRKARKAAERTAKKSSASSAPKPVNRKKFLIIPLMCILLFCAACGAKELPPDSSLPEPEPHNGVFTSEYGTMTFNGDGESITFDFTSELQDATGLPGGEQKGSYVFLFQHKQWRYDKAERFRIAVSDVSYDFINDFTVTDGNTIALQSPLNGEETILFMKGENEK